jgi:uncharacterized membrane protein YgdD (TMEM256/DUF423 family)
MLRLTALLGLTGVLLGALGAHGHIHDVTSTNGYAEQWRTGVQYHQIHALALLALTLAGGRDAQNRPRFRFSFIAFCLGILLFSGSLYLLAYTSVKSFGAITPLGGLAFMLGWLGLVRGGRTPAR